MGNPHGPSRRKKRRSQVRPFGAHNYQISFTIITKISNAISVWYYVAGKTTQGIIFSYVWSLCCHTYFDDVACLEVGEIHIHTGRERGAVVRFRFSQNFRWIFPTRALFVQTKVSNGSGSRMLTASSSMYSADLKPRLCSSIAEISVFLAKN